MTFTLAMVMNPRVWKRAQAEIDAVVGIDRLPEYDDRPSLPYVDAIVRVPAGFAVTNCYGGLPHATVRSDIYKGFYVPKGELLQIPVRYPNATEFISERFLNADGSLTDDEPSQFVFGFGRRICADADGQDIEFDPTYANGLTRRPEIFPYPISPRAHVNKETSQRIWGFIRSGKYKLMLRI
ncbi:cytochrome P450 [Phlebopus sp. FC_14]|nr:cytochrome P450 [Phlebopus sp. FC_14]